MQAEKIFITAPKGVPLSMLVTYLKRCIDTVPALKNALHGSDYEFVRVFGHRLSGTGGAYGIPALTEIGISMERAALQRNADEVWRQIATVEAYLGRIEIVSE